jgi:hypothetical protein
VTTITPHCSRTNGGRRCPGSGSRWPPALERETLDASMTLPDTLHVQAEMMMLRQVIDDMEAAH